MISVLVGSAVANMLVTSSEEQVRTEELARTAFLADSPSIPSLKKLWKEGNVAGFDGLMVCIVLFFYSLRWGCRMLIPIVRT